MKKFTLFSKNEQGAVAVVVAVAMTALLGFAALGIDFGLFYYQKSKLQTAVDAAAMAAVYELPNIESAKKVAKEYIVKNGCDAEQIVISFSSDKTKITIVNKENIDTVFAKILSVNTLGATCKATAAVTSKSNGVNVFDYLIFTGNDSHTLKLGGVFDIYGSIRANGKIFASPGHGYIQGNAEATYGCNINKWTTSFGDGGIVEGVERLEMPSFQSSINQVITYVPNFDVNNFSNYTYVNSSNLYKYRNGNYITFPENTFYDGDLPWGYIKAVKDLFINGSTGNGNFVTNGIVHVSGNVNANTFVSNGNLYVKGNISNTKLTMGTDCACYVVGNITTGGSSPSFKSGGGGYVYSDGYIKFGSSYQGDGCVFAKGNITFNGSSTKITNNKAIAIYSETGNIVLTCSSSDVYGIVYAPKGDCQISANLTFHGNIIADTLSSIPANLTMYPQSMDLPFELPTNTIKKPILIE